MRPGSIMVELSAKERHLIALKRAAMKRLRQARS